MSGITLKEKVILQAEIIARQSNQMSIQLNFLLRELYKSTNGQHIIFTTNKILSVNVGEAIKSEAAYKARQAAQAKIAGLPEEAKAMPLSSSSDIGA